MRLPSAVRVTRSDHGRATSQPTVINGDFARIEAASRGEHADRRRSLRTAPPAPASGRDDDFQCEVGRGVGEDVVRLVHLIERERVRAHFLRGNAPGRDHLEQGRDGDRVDQAMVRLTLVIHMSCIGSSTGVPWTPMLAIVPPGRTSEAAVSRVSG